MKYVVFMLLLTGCSSASSFWDKMRYSGNTVCEPISSNGGMTLYECNDPTDSQ